MGRRINRMNRGPKLPFETVKEKPKGIKKGLDESIQIKRSEYDELMEAFNSIKDLVGLDPDKIAETIDKVDQLFNGEVEVEIVDDNDVNEEVDIIEGEEVDGFEIEEEIVEEPNVEEEELIEGEDADITEILKDPAKKKAVLEFLKIEDADKVEDAEIKGNDSKRQIKRKALKGNDENIVADFTSRFNNGFKANDSDLSETPAKDLTVGYKNRWN